jgi:predicted enzyme related to lactoylglutathione lyase
MSANETPALAEVVILVGDLSRVEKFYTPFLGTPPHQRKPLATVYKLGEIRIAFHERPGATPEGVSLVLRVPDVRSAYLRALGNGAGSIQPPHTSPLYGMCTYAEFTDPAGVQVGLYTPLDQG